MDNIRFPKFESFLEKIIPKNKRIGFFVKSDKVLIGYFPEYATMADLSKKLPIEVKDAIYHKIKNSNFRIINHLIIKDIYTNKIMSFSYIPYSDTDSLKKLDDLFGE